MKETIYFRQLPYCLLLAAFFLLAAAPQPALAQDELIVLKDSLQIRAERAKNAEGGRHTGWVPTAAFTVRGSIPSGGQFWVSFGYPARRQWLKFDCGYPNSANRSFLEKDRWEVFCGLHETGTLYLGSVDFTINLRNPLTETNVVLYKGKFKAAKEPRYESYYVDEDWRFPIGYIFFGRFLEVRFWVRGGSGVQAHLFYQGKEIATSTFPGEVDPADGARYQWHYANIHPFTGVYLKKVPDYDAHAPNFAVSENPGEYEIKVLLYRQLARSIKFTVLPDGTIDNSIANANNLGIDSALVPVRVIGTASPWNKLAWKTEAFYGNPLTGFTAPP